MERGTKNKITDWLGAQPARTNTDLIFPDGLDLSVFTLRQILKQSKQDYNNFMVLLPDYTYTTSWFFLPTFKTVNRVNLKEAEN